MVDTLCFNGLNARTGQYLVPPMPADQVARLARGETLDPKELQALQRRLRHSRNVQFGPAEGIDPKEIDQTGWGVIFPFVKPGTDAAKRQAAVRAALEPLIALRGAQASARDPRFFHIFDDTEGAWRPTDTKRKWLKRQGAGATGPANPEKVPYYLMIVASPSVIDFRPQYLLDVQYAVGRLDFETVAEYARYAESVVAAEKGNGLALPRTAGFFGARSNNDASTLLSSEHLASPLASWAGKTWADWTVKTSIGDAAKKDTLNSWLGAGKTPSLLFTASHGMGFDVGDPQQRAHQGALLCSDWPGPQDWSKAIPQDFFLAGDDLGADARLHGLIAFNFACFGAGTPQRDSFSKQAASGVGDLAEAPFVASLPQRMLGHPGGGALAVIGHVDRAWGYSFLSDDGSSRGRQTRQLDVFQSTLQRLVDGHPVGSALEYFNERYAELAADLTDVLEEAEYGEAVDDWDLATLWTEQNDARGYAILGDPAVRLMVDREGAGRPRMPLELGEIYAAPEEPAVAPPADDPPAPEPSAAHTDFGWFSKDKDEGETDVEAEPGMLKRFATEVGEKLRDALTDVTSLEIRTFVADGAELAEVSKLRGDALAEKASLKAYTRMALDGDVDLLVPRSNGKVDKELWTAHQEMVKQAQAHRMELIKTALMLIKPAKT